MQDFSAAASARVIAPFGVSTIETTLSPVGDRVARRGGFAASTGLALGRMLALGAALWLGGLAAMPALAETSPDAARPAAELPLVTVDAARTTPVQARVAVLGSLVARQEVMIYPSVSGYAVTEILADVGDRVDAGQVLARLQDQTLAAQLAQAEADYQRADAGVKQAQSQILSSGAALTEAVTVLERARRLRQSGSGSQATLDQAVASEAAARAAAASAESGLGVAQAALALAAASRDIARLNLDYTRITAPVAGVIVARNAELGALSGGSSEPMFRLIGDGTIELAGEVVETAVPRLEAGQRAELHVAGLGAIAGRVRLLPAAVDPATRLGEVRIALDADARLRTGLFASGWIVVEDRAALTVPAGAVLADGEGNYVQIVKDGVIETRPVEAGLIWEGRREIVSGLSEGEHVLARAGAFFRTGDKIREAPAQQAATMPATEPAAEPATEPVPDGQAAGAEPAP